MDDAYEGGRSHGEEEGKYALATLLIKLISEEEAKNG